MNTDPLTAVAKAVRADVGCVAEVVRDQLFVTNRIGDRGLPPVWPLGPAATEALRTGSVIAPAWVPPRDLPMPLWERAGTPIAWVPLPSGFGPTSDLLIMLRPEEPYGPADLELLAAGAPRIGSVLEAQERGRAIERLAKAGPDLARYIDLGPLLDEAVVLFRELTATDSAFIVTIDEGIFELASYTGIDPSVPRRWPRTFATMPNWEQLSAGHPYVGQREIIPDRPHETHGSPTVLCVPIMRDGVAVALLGATGHRARSFGKTGVDVATILANHLSVAMQNAELYRALSEREQELQHRAAHDPLTGLANRVAASHRIEDALARSPDSAVGLMFCDVDKFKAVNDRLGHEAGDELIQQVAGRLATAVRPQDLLARFGGDEFVVIVDGARVLTDLVEAGRRMQVSLADPILLRGDQVEVTASIGAVLGRTGTSASVMLRNADAAMYAAKAKGPGRLEVFDDAAADRSLDRLDLRSELVHALERNELSVMYQPLIELKNNAIVSFEALVRWTHPQRGVIAPDVFIPMAEETGAIVPIGAWVLAEACARLREWQSLFPGTRLTMGVNTSAVQLESSNEDLVGVIERSGVDPDHIWLEVTERMDTAGDIEAQVTALRAAGVHFVLDDFGMSYSSLTYLQRFPVEGIKIDRTFIAPMTHGETQRGIVRAILALGQSLSVNVVAEGIETHDQLNALLDLGCALGQGFLLAPPLAPNECVTALAGR